MDVFVVRYSFTEILDRPDIDPFDPEEAATSTIYVLDATFPDGNEPCLCTDCECPKPEEQQKPTQVEQNLIIGLFDTKEAAMAYAYELEKDEKFILLNEGKRGVISIELHEYNLRMTVDEIAKRLDYEFEEE